MNADPGRTRVPAPASTGPDNRQVTHSLPTLVLVPLIAVLSPLLSDALDRWAPVPLVVFEIVLGVLVGPDVLHWAENDEYVSALSEFGLAMLFFMAGYEIDFERLRGGPLKRAVLGWGMSLVTGLAVGLVLAPSVSAGAIIGVALTTTALGTILPVLRDSGAVGTRFGDTVMAVGAVGEFAPIIAMTLFLSGRKPGDAMLFLGLFVLIAGAGVWFAVRGDHTGFERLADATMGSSGQFAVRLVVALLTLMVAATTALGVDMLLGAFSAGVIIRILFHGGSSEERTERVTSKLEAVGFGFLIPVFFIQTGIGYDLKALTAHTTSLLLLPLFLVLFLVVRGVPSYLTAPSESTGTERRALALYSGTALPLVVAITAIGVDRGTLKPSTAAAMVGAGMLSVLIYPLLALKVSGGSAAGEPAEDPVEAW